MINIYIDAEWYISQRIFLIGYAIEDTDTGDVTIHQVYHRNIYRNQIIKLFEQCTGFVFFWGPDIGMLEKRFRFPIRSKYHCVNLLRVTRLLIPGLPSYALASIEEHFGLYRKQVKYKKNIFSIYTDWRNPELKKKVLAYNFEDVYYLILTTRIMFAKYQPTNAWLRDHTLA